ncbi:NUDIX hydrolase [Bifidobacterium adolescentis]|uniref:NUDIX hydrolase n=1 Tax=Bifidobacterium adolescentis TaxID=1680 RepID=UPI003CE46D6B
MNANGNMTERHSTKPNEPIVDDVPPLIIQSEREVFREKGGADFTVTETIATVRHTGAQLQFHVASVRNGKTGAVCVVQKNGKDEPPAFLIARHWRVSTKQWAWEFPRGMELKDEDTLGTAIRELREETGIQVSRNQVTILQHIHADTGVLRDDIAVARILSSRFHRHSTVWRLGTHQRPLGSGKHVAMHDCFRRNYRWHHACCVGYRSIPQPASASIDSLHPFTVQTSHSYLQDTQSSIRGS